jgi:hypothetical protein
LDAAFDEDTSDAVLLRKVKAYKKLNAGERERIAVALRKLHKNEIDAFISTMRQTLTRRIASVFVLPLHGSPQTLPNVDETIGFIESFDESHAAAAFTRYEVGVRYSNGDEIRGQFRDKATAIAFLRDIR